MRLRLIRRKFIRRGELDAVPLIAPLPEKLQDRCIAAPGLLAQIIVGKYWGLPGIEWEKERGIERVGG